MDQILTYLCNSGRRPFERGFAVGTPPKTLKSCPPTQDDALCDLVVEWFTTTELMTEIQALFWWGDVIDPNIPATFNTCYAVNTTGRDVANIEWVEALLSQDELPPVPRMRLFFPQLFALDWQWEVFGQAPDTAKKAMIAFHYDSELHMWEAFYDVVKPETIWLCILMVGSDLDWDNAETDTPLNVAQFKQISRRVTGFVKISDSTAAALAHAEETFEDMASMSVFTAYDVWRVLVQFDGALDAMGIMGFESTGLEVEKIVCDNKPRKLRIGQSPFMARIWYLLYASGCFDWVATYIEAIKVIDETLFEDIESQIAFKQFEEYARGQSAPARWGSRGTFCVDNMRLFLQAVYWFQPRQCYVPWSLKNRTLYPVEFEQWRYECWRWRFENIHDQGVRTYRIPVFTSTEFNTSVLKIARIGELNAPLNRYAPSDL